MCEYSDGVLQGDSMRKAEPLVFVSYARPDLHGASAIVNLLRDAGVRTWFDKKDLKGGQKREDVVTQKIGDASLVLVCLSTTAADHGGFFHEEIEFAVREAMNLPKRKVFIVPVRFNDCAIPDKLHHLHAVDLFASSGSYNLLNSVGDALNLGVRARSEAHNIFAAAIEELNSGRGSRPSPGEEAAHDNAIQPAVAGNDSKSTVHQVL